jgi:hypothetical protein
MRRVYLPLHDMDLARHEHDLPTRGLGALMRRGVPPRWVVVE